jgi:hypothetical protein
MSRLLIPVKLALSEVAKASSSAVCVSHERFEPEFERLAVQLG